MMEDTDKPYGFSSLKHGLHETSTGLTLSFYHTNQSQTKITEKLVLVLIHGWPEMSV